MKHVGVAQKWLEIKHMEQTVLGFGSQIYPFLMLIVWYNFKPQYSDAYLILTAYQP